jgi:hydrogenase nickel incorporation protein HypA/HybF
MHEFTIATSIVDALLDLARQQGSDRVLEVQMKIGKLRAISIEQVKFSYDILAKGTPLEGSSLTVEESSGSLRCPECSYHGEFNPDDDLSFHFGVPPLLCPQCGNSLSIDGGDECVITKVRMVTSTAKEGTPERELVE